jgi:peptide/nickel transport system permease protein
MLLIVFGSSFLVYNLAAISGDPLEALRTSTEPNAKQQIITLTRQLQLDVPPPIRYFYWLQNVLSGDFGKARDGQLVWDTIASAIPVTIRLVTMATIIAIVLGITIGIVTALRQYSRFDYSMTFVSFLLYSLPVFWVAVLLKQYMAIRFNTFLATPTIPIGWTAFYATITGIFWAGVISGDRQRVIKVFGISFAATAVTLQFFSLTKWFIDPSLSIVGIAFLGVVTAIAITYVSTGLENRMALKAALAMAGIAVVLYYPMQWFFNRYANLWILLLLGIITIFVGMAVGRAFAQIDRGPVMRTASITGFIIGLFLVLDRMMREWAPYMQEDAINYRPVPTIGEISTQLEPLNFWIGFLDTAMHLILPTIALTLISFAGYVRFTRGTLLEVLNADYIRTARAKGLPERTVIMRHAFRNTLIPLMTIIVVDIAGIIGGAIITESVFGWVGMGTVFRRAISSFDLNLLMGATLITTTLAVSANLVADLLYSALDPRVRTGAGK